MADTPWRESGDALLVVDMQNDFCPGGALPIDGGDRIVPVVNHWIQSATAHAIPVIASRDWHPEQHISFTSEGGPWPRHCVQDTVGAEFHPELALPSTAIVVTKGTRFDHDQNSAFDQTGLAQFLSRKGIDRIFVSGLALDVCVLASALDARNAGIATALLLDATQPVSPLNGGEALQKMRNAGVSLVDSLTP